MNNEVSPANQAGKEESTTTEQITELSEDMEMVSPGAMLREARKALALPQEYIANKLNFKVGIVQNIEDDIFDPLMPVTFNRGYLVNYAKLVSVEVEDVLASYDALDAATIQRTEMLSFSRETAKQAEYSRVMWLSYLIVAVLIGLTILWWQQESRQQETDSLTVIPTMIIDKSVSGDVVVVVVDGVWGL
jgi:cytoskeleton protein RodZ